MKIFGKDITFGTKAKIAVTALVLAGCAFGGYSYYEAQQAEKAMRESAGETATVVRMEMKSTVSATGTIIPVDSVEVSSKITARIKNVLVKENDIVTAGETVATLDAKSLATKRDQAQFKVTNAKAKYDREAYLYSIGANPQTTFEDAQYNYDAAKSVLEETESDLAETIIQAPISGIVVGKPKTAGTMATAGTDYPTVIMRIADLSKKQIMAKVDGHRQHQGRPAGDVHGRCALGQDLHGARREDQPDGHREYMADCVLVEYDDDFYRERHLLLCDARCRRSRESAAAGHDGAS